jgi:glycosyltransferase involved in cell wall biosynthesis
MSQVGLVIETMPDFVDLIVCVDDASTDETFKVLINYSSRNKKVRVEKLPVNQGVGGAIEKGYEISLTEQADLIGVMAGDGQMDPLELSDLLDAILETSSDYAKISRLFDESQTHSIPRVRLIGNSILSGLTRLSSGYWNMTDSQTGYTVISNRALTKINGNLWKSYGFPNDVLNRLGLHNFKIVEIASRPIYDVGEVSKLKPHKVAVPILLLCIRGILRRIKVQYLQRTLHPIGIGYFFSACGLGLSSVSLSYLFFYEYLAKHFYFPIQLMVSLFILQTSAILLWLSLLFDALANNNNSVFFHPKPKS